MHEWFQCYFYTTFVLFIVLHCLVVICRIVNAVQMKLNVYFFVLGYYLESCNASVLNTYSASNWGFQGYPKRHPKKKKEQFRVW